MLMTAEDVVGPWGHSPDLTDTRIKNIHERLIPAVQALEQRMRDDGVEFPTNSVTKTGVSGKTFGGFRPQDCPQGAPLSNHKQGLAVDRFDPHGDIDRWCLDHLDVLEECGIWIESPSHTPGWSHWQCVPPKSGRRVFVP